MFLNRSLEAARQQIETDQLHEEMMEELIENYNNVHEDLLNDREKAVHATLDVMAELDRFARATIDLDIDHDWLHETVRIIRMFRIELDLRVKGYANYQSENNGGSNGS